ncbi:MAG: hypothetical protein NZ811_07150 [Gammaproteobacteria bacterium]|nr:hypothetical protein [Gammaproteobacteria bacterium]
MEYIWILYTFFAVALYATHHVSYRTAVRDTMVDTIVMLEDGRLTYTCEESEEGYFDVTITVKDHES